MDANNKVDPDLPDRFYGDFYCRVCDSHMNNDQMWVAHIMGKRHLKTVKKGSTNSKYEDLLDVESDIKYELRTIEEPVVGLSYIHEIRRKEAGVPSIFNCFLCNTNIATTPLVIEHVISMKHRQNYLKKKDPEKYQLIQDTNLSLTYMEPLVIEAVKKMEEKFGRGTVKVKQEKNKNPLTYIPKKPVDMNAERNFQFNSMKYFEEHEGSKSPKTSDFEDDYGRCPKSYSAEKTFERKERSRTTTTYDFNDEYGRSRKSYPSERSLKRRERSISPIIFDRDENCKRRKSHASEKTRARFRRRSSSSTSFDFDDGHDKRRKSFTSENFRRRNRSRSPREVISRKKIGSPYEIQETDFVVTSSTSHKCIKKEKGSLSCLDEKQIDKRSSTAKIIGKPMQPNSEQDKLKELENFYFLKIVFRKLSEMDLQSNEELILMADIIKVGQEKLLEKLSLID